MTAPILIISFINPFFSLFCNFSTTFLQIQSISCLGLCLCHFSAARFPVLFGREDPAFFFIFLTSIVTIFTIISFPSSVACSLNSSLFALLIIMLVFSLVLGDFFSGDITNLPSCCSLVYLFSFCLALNYILYSYSTVLE